MRGAALFAISLFLGVLPALLWLAYYCYLGRSRPGLATNVTIVFLWGCASTLPASLPGLLTGTHLAAETPLWAVTKSFLVIAPVEELCKLAAVWVAIYRKPAFREPLDGIIFAATAALGFAAVENVRYMVELGPDAVIRRLAFVTPAHVMFSAMWGYSMGVARFSRDRELIILAKGLATATLLHGMYNSAVALCNQLNVLPLLPTISALMGVMAWMVYRRVKASRAEHPFQPLGEGALICCPTCGAFVPESSEQCPRCEGEVPRYSIDSLRFCAKCRAELAPCSDSCPRCGEAVTLLPVCSPR